VGGEVEATLEGLGDGHGTSGDRPGVSEKARREDCIRDGAAPEG
jgi:hypothetical protein